MSSMDRLGIVGIRSFSPSEMNIIHFYTPLTIIVGHNGAGKTTIIECLKYATTGDFPPNSNRGKSFVMDPKVVGEREVKAQIKLRFRNTASQQMTITRSMSLAQTRRNAPPQLTTLESVMKMNENTSLSSRCADMDRAMCNELGVSKAILENVIFCHQEDSLWPLSDSATLKKKFDEIFAASRYTKALETIKDLKKGRAQDIKVERERVENLRRSKDRAVQLQTERRNTEAEINAIDAQMNEYDAEIGRLGAEAGRAKEALDSLEEYSRSIEQLLVRNELLEKDRNRLKGQMRMMQDTDEQLQHMLNHQESIVKDEEGAVNHAVKQRDAMEEKKRRITEDINQQQQSIGRLTAEKSRFAESVAKRDDLMTACNQRYHIMSEEEVENATVAAGKEFVKKLKESVDATRANLERLTSRHAEQQRQYQEKMEELRLRYATAENEAKRLKADNNAKYQQIQKWKDELLSYPFTNEELEDVNNLLVGLREQANSFPFDFDAARQEIRMLEQEKRQFEARLAELSSKRKMLSIQQTNATKLSLRRSELQTARQQFESMYKPHRDEFEALLGPGFDVAECSTHIHSSVRHCQRELQEAKVNFGSQRAKLENLENSLRLHVAKKADLKRQIAGKLGKIQIPANVTFSEHLLETESLLNRKSRQLRGLEVASDFYEKYIGILASDHKCPLCSRGFHNPPEEESFRQKLLDLITVIPPHVEDTQREFNALKETLAELQRVQSSVSGFEDELRKIDSEMPALESEIQAQHVAMENMEQGTIHELEAKEHGLSSLNRVADKLVPVHKRIQELKQDVASLESQTSTSASLEDLDIEEGSVKLQSNDINQSLDEKRAVLSSQESQYRLLQDRINEATRKQMDLSHRHEKRQSLEGQRKRLEEELQKNTRDVNALYPRMEEDKRAQAELAEKAAAVDREFQESQRSLQNQLQSMQPDLMKLSGFTQQMDEFLMSGREIGLKEAQMSLQRLESEKKAAEVQIAKCNTDIDAIRNQLRNTAENRRNIQDNVQYREGAKEIQANEGEVRRLTERLNGVNVNQLKREKAQCEASLKDISLKKQRDAGRREILHSNVASLDRELRNPECRDAEEQFRLKLIELKLSELAISDLEKYSKAIDSAIMRYHVLKMEEINKIMKELWTKTYRGNDIDTIEIRSAASEDADENKPTATLQLLNNRSYNYRVVMIKDNQALDIRGRCSAGQKVLAAVIIRLALAETFGLHCGILALDEPTTNLDQENIDSLAESLKEIIESRCRQRNFQLVVITHDEEFAQKLGMAQYAEHYYRVSKDPKHFSVIERQNVRTFN